MVVQRALEQRIQEGVLKRLYMVHNIENTHWVAVEVDVTASQIRIGDSLEWNRSCSDLVTGLNAWLSTTLHQPFKVSYDLPHGKQQDTYSCGICSINAIEHRIVPSIPLWTPALRHVIRMEKFGEIARRYLDQVCLDALVGLLPETTTVR